MLLPTSDYYNIEVDTSWYIKDKGLKLSMSIVREQEEMLLFTGRIS